MTDSPFAHRFEELPNTIPVFPLAGVLLLPRGRLPLNIFEPRYLNMVRDALGAGRLIGMIQPLPEADGAAEPALYRVGCAGRITEFAETDDDRLLITLTGVCRFTVDQEVTSMRGYRRVVADWSRFESDFTAEGGTGLDREALTRRLRLYFDAHDITADWDTIRDTPNERLMTTLAMVCPFAPNEKQALLEADDLKARSTVLATLLDMATLGEKGGDHARH
ncbi:MAG: LON peptidase substrate-binding domain-containing protein [Alphaproteobacteria bacterium]|nr:LON peptidase substrate-binding domain-containing protein [Alphaproteobacteria bacterium]